MDWIRQWVDKCINNVLSLALFSWDFNYFCFWLGSLSASARASERFVSNVFLSFLSGFIVYFWENHGWVIDRFGWEWEWFGSVWDGMGQDGYNASSRERLTNIEEGIIYLYFNSCDWSWISSALAMSY